MNIKSGALGIKQMMPKLHKMTIGIEIEAALLNHEARLGLNSTNHYITKSTMTEQELKVSELAAQAAVYVPFDCEGIRINYVELDDTDGESQGSFSGTGEETGQEYKIFFQEVDLDQDQFYKLVAIN